MIKNLNKSTVERVERPVRILQFGEGNFLRAFADWAIDITNEKGVMNAGVAICKPRPRKVGGAEQMLDVLQRQDNMYHVYLEGIEHKQPKRDVRMVRSVMDSFNPYEEYEKYEQYILSPELNLIISNTTEAGIRYEEEDDLEACPPISFPAKIAALLYRRYKHFGGDKSKGLVIICCELIENNGSTLKEYVLRHARRCNLEQEFVDWVESSCSFCNSLVVGVSELLKIRDEKRYRIVVKSKSFDQLQQVIYELYQKHRLSKNRVKLHIDMNPLTMDD